MRQAFEQERDFTDSNPSCWNPLFMLDLHLRTNNFKRCELTHKYEPLRIRPVASALNSRSSCLESTKRMIVSISCLNVFPRRSRVLELCEWMKDSFNLIYSIASARERELVGDSVSRD